MAYGYVNVRFTQDSFLGPAGCSAELTVGQADMLARRGLVEVIEDKKPVQQARNAAANPRVQVRGPRAEQRA